jgi:hypothetical protein
MCESCDNDIMCEPCDNDIMCEPCDNDIKCEPCDNDIMCELCDNDMMSPMYCPLPLHTTGQSPETHDIVITRFTRYRYHMVHTLYHHMVHT